MTRPQTTPADTDREVTNSQNSVILQQVKNGLAIRMAVLFLVTQAAPDRHSPGDAQQGAPRTPGMKNYAGDRRRKNARAEGPEPIAEQRN